MKKQILATVVASVLGATAAAAPVVPLSEQPLYWGVGYNWMTYSEDAWITDANPGAVGARLGYQHSDMISGELRYIHGTNSGNVTLPDGEAEVDVTSMYGLYGKINLLTDINFTPYAILGFTQGEAEGSMAASSASHSESDFSYGVGVDLCRDQPVCLNVEYVSYLAKDNFNVESYSVGIKARF